MTRDIHRIQQVAVLSVKHPILGTDLEIPATAIHVCAEQYFALVDELCTMAFLCPHLSLRIRSLAHEIKLPEVERYIEWMREADTNKSWQAAA